MPSFKHDIERFLNLARVKLPGSTDAAIKQELFDTLHEWFSETAMWTEDITIAILANQGDYQLNCQEPGEIVTLGGAINKNGDAQPVDMPSIGVMHLRDIPSNADTWTARVIKVPGSNLSRWGVPEIPEWVLPKWGPYILDGLLGRMMGQINKPYTNERMALYHLRRFRGSITIGRAAALRANTYGVNAWAYPQAFRSRGQRGGVSTAGGTF